ncbi:MAG: hypothetical protein WBI14_02495, partial [Anaerolineaceae bacterium]
MKKAMIRALPEAELARFQTLQQGNDCALHAISSAIYLLTEKYFTPGDLINLANRLWWRGRFYRILPSSGIFPHMQLGLLNYLIRHNNLPLKANLLHLSPEILRNLPHDDDIAALVTIYWPPKKAPGIYLGGTEFNYNGSTGLSGHTMLFSAYDPNHVNGRIGLTPWGFINSWIEGGADLFWMTDEDFRRAWSFRVPWIGYNATLVISRSDRTIFTL